MLLKYREGFEFINLNQFVSFSFIALKFPLCTKSKPRRLGSGFLRNLPNANKILIAEPRAGKNLSDRFSPTSEGNEKKATSCEERREEEAPLLSLFLLLTKKCTGGRRGILLTLQKPN